jgi:proteasome assembly chaperone (PAC2) family protein
LDKPYIKLSFKPELENPILIAGFPGVGNIGVISTKLLVESLGAELFAELYSPALPDYVTVDANGLCDLLKYSFFRVSVGRDLVILVGDAQPPIDDIPAYYEVCTDILDFIEKIDCNFIITADGIPASYSQRRVYVAGTSKSIVSEYASMGAEIYDGGRIIGMPGLLLGLAKIRGIEGICLLITVVDLVADQEAAFNACRFLRRALRIGIEKTI